MLLQQGIPCGVTVVKPGALGKNVLAAGKNGAGSQDFYDVSAVYGHICLDLTEFSRLAFKLLCIRVGLANGFLL